MKSLAFAFLKKSLLFMLSFLKYSRKSEITNEVLYLTYNLDIKKLFDFDNMYVPSLYNRVLATTK
jgi:hypothetical protein